MTTAAVRIFKDRLEKLESARPEQKSTMDFSVLSRDERWFILRYRDDPEQFTKTDISRLNELVKRARTAWQKAQIREGSYAPSGF